MKNSFVNVIIIFFFVLSADAQTFNLGNSINNNGWFKLGQLHLPQQGADAEIKIISGGGYNAEFSQQGECFIHFRTSNGSSNNQEFYGSGTFYNIGRSKILSNIRIVQVDLSTWDFYAVLPNYTGNYATLSLISSAGQWDSGFIKMVPPIGKVFIDLQEEMILNSPTTFTQNVGIGTIVPDEKLTVKGKIHAQEIRIDLQGSLVPDYVFAKEYSLKTLQEVENFININNHLPEIPSAQEIEKNGLMLAEMNMSLLKKIEELTLYTIQQNKNMIILQNKIEALESKENNQ